MDNKKTLARILGSGIYNLDTNVIREYPDGPGNRRFTETVLGDEVGGTCGNVMCILAGLGLEAYPQACLDDSPEGLRITEDLNRFGCDTRFVTNTPDGGTSLLRVTRKRFPDGSMTVGVQAGSPGGSRFPKRRFLRVRDQAPAFVQTLLEDFLPDFYFFDDPAAGHRYIAGVLREHGTTVYFEPARVETNADLESVRLSDIVKFSKENIPDTTFADGFRDKLFVQTLGKDGLRYKFLGGDWKTLPPVVNAHVVDTEGAGDATTSAIISGIASSGRRFRDLDEPELLRILTEAQHFASKSVSKMGTKAAADKD